MAGHLRGSYSFENHVFVEGPPQLPFLIPIFAVIHSPHVSFEIAEGCAASGIREIERKNGFAPTLQAMSG